MNKNTHEDYVFFIRNNIDHIADIIMDLRDQMDFIYKASRNDPDEGSRDFNSKLLNALPEAVTDLDSAFEGWCDVPHPSNF